MRLDEKGGQLKLFVPRDEHDQKEAFAICLAKEMIRFLGLPEAESWHIITAVLAVEPERLDSFLHRQGISNNCSATPSDVEQAKGMTVSLEDETIILDTMFRTLSISSQQNNNKDNEISVNILSTSTMTTTQTRSVNIKADINQHPTSSVTTPQACKRYLRYRYLIDTVLVLVSIASIDTVSIRYRYFHPIRQPSLLINFYKPKYISI
jgi:hypothetical protein